MCYCACLFTAELLTLLKVLKGICVLYVWAQLCVGVLIRRRVQLKGQQQQISPISDRQDFSGYTGIYSWDFVWVDVLLFLMCVLVSLCSPWLCRSLCFPFSMCIISWSLFVLIWESVGACVFPWMCGGAQENTVT